MIYKIKCNIEGSGIDYAKRVTNISEKNRQLIKECTRRKIPVIFYTKTKGEHYTQSGYKVVTYNPERFEYYHREPTAEQFKKIQKGEKLKK